MKVGSHGVEGSLNLAHCVQAPFEPRRPNQGSPGSGRRRTARAGSHQLGLTSVQQAAELGPQTRQPCNERDSKTTPLAQLRGLLEIVLPTSSRPCPVEESISAPPAPSSVRQFTVREVEQMYRAPQAHRSMEYNHNLFPPNLGSVSLRWTIGAYNVATIVTGIMNGQRVWPFPTFRLSVWISLLEAWGKGLV